MRRLRLAILLVVIGLTLVVFTQQVRAWSAGIWYVGIVPTPDHHGDLAERAVRCLNFPQKLFPPGCRSAIPVDSEFFIGQLRRGSQMPDLERTLGDGVSSSLHSLNPRYNAGLDPSIRAAHGIPVEQTIVPGKADFAIDREITAVKQDIRLLKFDCRNPDVQGYSWLWRDLGRLSHYIADIHSPFHPNSFGIAAVLDDYHEGAVHPRTGLWFKGLWDQGRPGQLEHFRNETLKLGIAADIPNIPCVTVRPAQGCRPAGGGDLGHGYWTEA